MATKTTDQPELSVKALAERLKTDPRELRKFLRSEGMGVGRRGKRYTFTAQQVAQVSRKFKAAQKKAAAEKKDEKAEEGS
jgi:CO/xanthine dehydrogenase Mo-binding subunit